MTANGLLAVEIARDWIGTPYRHQASCQGAGCDCLGLLRGVWRELYGAEPEHVPAYTLDWSEPEGKERLWAAASRHLVPCHEEAGAGQVLLFRMREGSVAKHLGISSSQRSFIHAYSGHGVVESALTAPWLRRVVARFDFP
ncbi:NlpC/P60 family protein [Defluviimonas sp. WL0002]|uniref:NlpC/P60 family protein n=1 Tax=Albidovulum marisflavi TaxID=2984159 RepID=A0ABT2ZBW3_9RHOB|nr:NlpC/P60 family protein [Defluviimonas sp. WL0002]MCV2868540.1 NlpC/P60 family protein [Defluviimonas sp. WL0002]